MKKKERKNQEMEMDLVWLKEESKMKALTKMEMMMQPTKKNRNIATENPSKKLKALPIFLKTKIITTQLQIERVNKQKVSTHKPKNKMVIAIFEMILMLIFKSITKWSLTINKCQGDKEDNQQRKMVIGFKMI